jgi:hypothetical protein
VAKAYEILISIFCPGGKAVLDFPGSGPGMVEACISCQRQIFVGVPGSMEVPAYAEAICKIAASNLPKLSEQHFQKWESLQNNRSFGLSVASHSASKQSAHHKGRSSKKEVVEEAEGESGKQEDEQESQQDDGNSSDSEEEANEEGGSDDEADVTEEAEQSVDKVQVATPPASSPHKRAVPNVSDSFPEVTIF